MNILMKQYTDQHLDAMIRIWNEVVEDGIAFPQEQPLDRHTGAIFFQTQSYCGVATDADDGTVTGLYILHPNNIGRCGHICNASYAVAKNCRGLHIGEALVCDSLVQGQRHGFGILQFNAVVASNLHARHLYERLGFVALGTRPNGFRHKDGSFEDICPYYHTL